MWLAPLRRPKFSPAIHCFFCRLPCILFNYVYILHWTVCIFWENETWFLWPTLVGHMTSAGRESQPQVVVCGLLCFCWAIFKKKNSPSVSVHVPMQSENVCRQLYFKSLPRPSLINCLLHDFYRGKSWELMLHCLWYFINWRGEISVYLTVVLNDTPEWKTNYKVQILKREHQYTFTGFD